MLGRSKTRQPAETLSTQRFRRYLVAGFIAVAVFALFQRTPQACSWLSNLTSSLGRRVYSD
jgi:hypothetical protein